LVVGGWWLVADYTEEFMKNTFLGAIVVALGLGATVPFVGWAQDQPQAQADQTRHGGRGFGRPGGPGGRMGGPMGGAFGFREVMRDLTDAQREQVRGIHERHADRIRPLAERAHAAREAINNAVFSGNDGNLQALSIEVGNAETELTFAQAQVQSEILTVLTPEQKQTIAERRKQMEARRAEMTKRRQERSTK
jgi:Spy/CpxP family protein refolding chaperone